MPTHPEPISFYARKSTGAWRAAVEQELERIRSDRLLRVAALGALSGARSFTPLAWIAAHHVRKGRPEGAHPLLNRKAAAALAVASAGELAFDKYPRAPSRIDPPALAGRALTGGLVGSALGRLGERTRKKTPIVLGALAAIAGTLLSYQARRALSKRIGPFAAALTEDVLTLGGTALVTRTL